MKRVAISHGRVQHHSFFFALFEFSFFGRRTGFSMGLVFALVWTGGFGTGHLSLEELVSGG